MIMVILGWMSDMGESFFLFLFFLLLSHCSLLNILLREQ